MTKKISKLILEDKTNIIINLQQNLQLNDVSILIINNFDHSLITLAYPVFKIRKK